MAASTAPGIRNFDQVDARLYRGAQPSAEGFRYLAQLGVKVVVDLRGPGRRSRAEERTVTAAGMRYVHVPMSGIAPPSEAAMASVLGVVEDGTAGVVFVHCRRGADRTGTVVAVYRIDHDRWDSARALREARLHGMGFFQVARRRYIRRFRKPSPASASAPRT